MGLCNTCNTLDIQQCRRKEGLIAVYRIQALEYAAKNSCTFCQFLCDTLAKEIKDAKTAFRDAGYLYLHAFSDGKEWDRASSLAMRINELRVYFAQGYWGMSPRLLFGIENASNDMVVAQHTYRVLADIDSAASKSGDVIGTYLGGDPRSSNHIAAVQEWLITCLTNHSDCCKRASGGDLFDARDVPLPTRCLDIKDPGNVMLKETGEERGAYIALSHRWGAGTALCRTETSNYDERKLRIDTKTLPQVFQDVIHFTRLLGIQYIWIDSLCIIQDGDDGADWKKEAIRMGQYYQYSLATIAITTPPDGSHGCFPTRPPALTGKLVRLPYINACGQQDGFIYIHKRDSSVHDEYRSTVLNSELLKRGWVLQEWLLSRRLIFFTPTQLFFECQSTWPNNEFNETAHLGLELGEITNRVHFEWKVPLKPLFSYKTKPIGDLWCTIVETYSTLRLTKPELDTIIAVAGIAEEVGQMIAKEAAGRDAALLCRNEYLAGLWLQDLHHGLLWEQRTDWPAIASRCGAPTWSWASGLVPVKWQARGKRVWNACKILALTLDDGHTVALDDHSIASLMGGQAGSTSIEADLNQDASPSVAGESFGVTNTFTCLTIRGQLRPFLVGRLLSADETAKISSYTGQTINFGRVWRVVSDPLHPGKHLGWASIEATSVNRQLQHSSPSDGSGYILLQALHVSTLKGVTGGIQFGHLGLTHNVYCVLFIEHEGNDKYRRVGTGRIFHPECFKGVEEQCIQLL